MLRFFKCKNFWFELWCILNLWQLEHDKLARVLLLSGLETSVFCVPASDYMSKPRCLPVKIKPREVSNITLKLELNQSFSSTALKIVLSPEDWGREKFLYLLSWTLVLPWRACSTCSWRYPEQGREGLLLETCWLHYWSSPSPVPSMQSVGAWHW